MADLELYYWPTPNGHKITMFLEEVGLDYEIKPVNIGAGDQFKPEFLAISPNNRMPALIDRAPSDGGAPLSIFESGAILQYLARKVGKLWPDELRAHVAVSEWLFWQVANLGPMAGQNHHFVLYAPEKIPYAIDRYVRETNRLHGVLERRLSEHAYLAGAEYSIADIATYPWVVPWKRQQQDLDAHPHLRRWFDDIRARPATQRAYARADAFRAPSPTSEAARKILFGQTAESVKQAARQAAGG
jgi:GSH-dependent disulfide-bond oxidoreductase